MNLTQRVLERLAWLEYRMSRMEQHVTQIDDVIAELNDATNQIAEELDALRGDVANVDTVTAQKFQPLVDRLRQLAADPSNPVPPADGGQPTP
jgi:uncharacterized coiled-coil protein SlyX